MNSKLNIDREEIIKHTIYDPFPNNDYLVIRRLDIHRIIDEIVNSILTYENIEKIILTYKSFSDRSCPGTIIKQTIEKLKADNLLWNTKKHNFIKTMN